jgi:hypothetical protein
MSSQAPFPKKTPGDAPSLSFSVRNSPGNLPIIFTEQRTIISMDARTPDPKNGSRQVHRAGAGPNHREKRKSTVETARQEETTCSESTA